MALLATDLIYPTGDLLPSLFPDGDIQSTVIVWLAEAQVATPSEHAQRHWVYYRAYSAVARRIAGLPNSEGGINGGSVGWGSDRVAYFQAQADAQLAEYRRLTGNDAMTAGRVSGFKVY